MPKVRIPRVNMYMAAGRATKDAEIHTFQSGNSITKFTLAVDTGYFDRDGQWVSRSAFIDVKVPGKKAEKVSEDVRKGTPVMVQGAIQQEEWEAQDGQKRSRLVCFAQSVSPLEWGHDSSTTDAPEPYRAPQSTPAPQPQPRQEPAAPAPPDDDIPF